MKVVSLNISLPQVITFNRRTEQTGFFKTSVNDAIYLGFEDVKDDSVLDRVHHGGRDKACYLYSYDHYNYWKQIYPDLNWDFGMFGENITVEELDESKIRIGDIYKVGEAVVQISQPRQPCYKLGIKFGNQKMVKAFCNAPYPGVYVRVLQEGLVGKAEVFELIKSDLNSLTVLEVFQLIYAKKPDKQMVLKACSDPLLAGSVKEYLARKFDALISR